MATTNDSISPKVIHCLDRFSGLLRPGFAPEMPLSIWEDELGRLRVWVANNNVFPTITTSGQQSLDDRLRDASHIRTQVVRQLDRLSRILDDLEMLERENPGPGDISDSESEEFSEDLRSSTIGAYRNLVGSIDSLNRMSMLIRKPAPFDQLGAAALASESKSSADTMASKGPMDRHQDSKHGDKSTYPSPGFGSLGLYLYICVRIIHNLPTHVLTKCILVQL